MRWLRLWLWLWLGLGLGLWLWGWLNNLRNNIIGILGLNDGLWVGLGYHRRGAFGKVGNSKLLNVQIDKEDKFAMIFPRNFAVGEVNTVAIVGEVG